MPNTLAHLGVETLLGRRLQPAADVKWILLGCVIPDIPWIVQVLGRTVGGINLIDLRLYAIVQSSLLFCLVLAAALALLSRAPVRSFVTLTIAIVLHLLLDATQTKLGNGVLLAVPLDWRLLNLGLYWPEDAPSYALTLLGAVTMGVLWLRDSPAGALPARKFIWPSCAMLLLWLAGPMIWMQTAEVHNLHNTAILRPGAVRTGQAFTVDRNTARVTPEGVSLTSWTGEVFDLTGVLPETDAVVSLRGRFTAANQIAVTALHIHQDGPREWFSYIGLLIVLLWWAVAGWRGFRYGSDS